MSEFYSILTKHGIEQIANATISNTLINLKTMVVGDGDRNPTEEETALSNQLAEVQIQRISIDPDRPSEVIADAIIPGNIGGFWIREIGLKDAAGELFAIGRYPATYKPVVEDGAVKDVCVRMVLRVTNAEQTIISYSLGIIEWADLDLKNLSTAGQAKLDAKADLDSPVFIGTPTAPTPAIEANDTRLATTAFVRTGLAALVNSAPATLETLNQLAEAIDNDPNFAVTIANALALKANIASPALTGIPMAPTASKGTRTEQIATTAFVNDFLPVGHIIECMFPDAVPGYLPAWNPAVQYNRATYSTLFQRLVDNGWITSASGNGTTTFTIPDFRGRFLRCVGGSAAAIGIAQGADFSSHTHTQNAHTHTQNQHNHGFPNQEWGWIEVPFVGNNNSRQGGIFNTPPNASSWNNSNSGWGNGGGGVLTIRANFYGRAVNNTTPTNQNTTAINQNTGGTETRPVNFAIYPFIKY